MHTTPQENYHENFIWEACSKMNINDLYASEACILFNRFKSKKTGATRDLIALAAYSIYNTLKNNDAHKSIKFISNYTGVTVKRLWGVEKCFGSATQPISVNNILESNYHFFNLEYKDYLLLAAISHNFTQRSHSPNTMAATLVYMYCKYRKIKCTLCKAASIFQISPMSIHRCMRFLKSTDFYCILSSQMLKKT